MNKIRSCLLVFVLLLALVGCTETAVEAQTVEPASSTRMPQAGSTQEEIEMQQIKVRDLNGHEVIFALNDSDAAAALLDQLPLETEADNFSNNEKIFYPPHSLPLENTPLAKDGAGTLAYYAPWGNVVMFYGDYRANSELYALGSVSNGAEQIKTLIGMLTIEQMD